MSSAETYQLVKNAIEGRQQIVAMSGGCLRHLCPHVIGMKYGREQGLFYQFGGKSRSRKIVPNSSRNWRRIALSKLTIIEIRDGEFFPNPSVHLPDASFDEVDIRSRHEKSVVTRCLHGARP